MRHNRQSILNIGRMIFVAFLILLLQPTSTAYGASLTVNTTSDTHDAAPGDGTCSDGSACSLRAAIEEANALTGADIITLPAGTYTLTQGSELYITSDITINGDGAATTIIQANASANNATYRVLRNNGGTVLISDVTIRHGVCAGSCAGTLMGASGGGILNQSGTLTLDASSISANTATYGGGIHNAATLTIQSGSAIGGAGAGNSATVDGYGGGIFNDTGGTTTIDASTVSANTAVYGGGIRNVETLNIQNGSVIGGAGVGNTATNDGGGIYNALGTTTINASTVSANTATNDGGGIYNLSTEPFALTIQNGSVIGGAGAGNSAAGGVSGGGGIYSGGGATTITSSTVSANTATDGCGGGIWNGAGATMMIEDVSVVGRSGAGNSARYGGGICNSTGTLTIDASTVSANTTAGVNNAGGGIYNTGSSGTLTIQNGSVIGGTGAGNSSTKGGGIDNTGGGILLVIDASTVSANSAYYGAGIYNDGGDLTVENNSLIGGADAGNVATYGGGIFNHNGTAMINSSTVSANTALDAIGGGIYNDATLTIVNDSLIGGVGAGNSSTGGGGIHNAGGTATIDGSTVSSNTATNGGGIYIAGGATLIVQNGSLLGGVSAGNSATDNGGGIFNDGGALTMTESKIVSNTAGANGGGLYNFNLASSLSVTGSCVTGNSSTAFVNTYSSTQTATGNWWGAASGPNPPGSGDSISGNWDTSGSLAKPPIMCGGSATGLNSTGVSLTQIDLSWTDNASDETSFRIERSSNNVTFSEIDSVGASVTTYSDTTLSCGQTRYYRVRARNADNDSAYSNTATATTLCPAVSLSNTSHDFGNQLISTTSGGFTITVTNDGTADLNVGTLGITGDFALANDLCTDATIAPTNNCTFDVTFTPASVGAKSGSVSIPNDAPGNPHSVSLSGTGIPPNMLINGGMELDANADKIPDGWKKSTTINTKNDKQDCVTLAHGGLCSFTIKGNGNSKKLTQSKSFSVALAKYTPFTFSVWVKTSGVPASGKYAQVKLVYTDGTTKVVKLNILSGAADWTQYTASFSATKKVKSVTVILLYNQASGFIWFDDISLTTP